MRSPIGEREDISRSVFAWVILYFLVRNLCILSHSVPRHPALSRFISLYSLALLVLRLETWGNCGIAVKEPLSLVLGRYSIGNISLFILYFRVGKFSQLTRYTY